MWITFAPHCLYERGKEENARYNETCSRENRREFERLEFHKQANNLIASALTWLAWLKVPANGQWTFAERLLNVDVLLVKVLQVLEWGRSPHLTLSHSHGAQRITFVCLLRALLSCCRHLFIFLSLFSPSLSNYTRASITLSQINARKVLA